MIVTARTLSARSRSGENICMATFGRRKFIITGTAATFSLSLATLLTHKSARAGDYGALVPDPDGILDLPPGFSYRILERKGDSMTDGYRVPGRADGMACFQGPNNTLILMRNHEVSLGDGSNGPYKNGQSVAAESYDPQGRGGVTRLVVDATTFERISSNLVLVGTARNCCGGRSPWGWISCEEETTINGNYRHGYAFLCPTDAESVQPPLRLDGYGRFNHEAAAVDPSNYYAYLTEDRGNSCLYRFVPDSMDEPFHGQLQALKVVGKDEFATTNMNVGDVVDIEWVDIDNPDPDGDNIRDQGHDKGAAVFVRGEGISFFEGQVYVCCTTGGDNGKGQIFRLIDGDNPTLELVVQSTGSDVLDKPDNICVAPWGELFAAEDGDNGNYIRWITAQGEVHPFAHNVGSSSEFAGICFSPDGRAMFVNIQSDHRTLVITGPFPEVIGSGDGDGESTSEGESSTDGGETTTDGGESTTDGGETTTDGGDSTTTDGGDTTTDGGDSTTGDHPGKGKGKGHGHGKPDQHVPDGERLAAELEDEDFEGQGCSVADEPKGAAALAAGLATVALGTLLRDREE